MQTRQIRTPPAGRRRRCGRRCSWPTSSCSFRRASVALEYACGAIGALDTYSSYLTSDQLNDVYSQIEGNFVGLGIELKASDGALQIVKVITGSPAERAGIRAGDRITEVDGKATAELTTDQAADLLQGPKAASWTSSSSDAERRRRAGCRSAASTSRCPASTT